MSSRVQFTNNAATTLSVGCSAADTTLTVTSSLGFPPVLTGSNWFYACLQDTFANTEIVKVTNIVGTVWTVVRGIGGYTARAFVSGASIDLRLTAEGLSDLSVLPALVTVGGSINNTPIGATFPSTGSFVPTAATTTALKVNGVWNIKTGLVTNPVTSNSINFNLAYNKAVGADGWTGAAWYLYTGGSYAGGLFTRAGGFGVSFSANFTTITTQSSASSHNDNIRLYNDSSEHWRIYADGRSGLGATPLGNQFSDGVNILNADGSFTRTGNLTTAAGTTSMVDGFIRIPASGGPPTGVPTAVTGQVPLYFDTTNNRLYAYNGAWKKVGVA
jgi:hypothetical protein